MSHDQNSFAVLKPRRLIRGEITMASLGGPLEQKLEIAEIMG